MDPKFPILLGDKFHTSAYFVVSKLGSTELCKILASIEENFSKLFSQDNLNFNRNFDDNLELIYK